MVYIDVKARLLSCHSAASIARILAAILVGTSERTDPFHPQSAQVESVRTRIRMWPVAAVSPFTCEDYFTTPPDDWAGRCGRGA